MNLREELICELSEVAQSLSDEQSIRLRDQILKNFDNILHQHRELNCDLQIDSDYKLMITDTIEAKSMAARKIQIFAEAVLAGSEPAILERILVHPILEFSRQTAVLELRTGLRDFPWADVAAGGETVHFGDWSPAGVDPWRLDLVVQALAAQAAPRAVRVAGDRELRLPADGWAAEQVAWDASPAARAAPAAAALLLRCCTRLTSLSLR